MGAKIHKDYSGTPLPKKLGVREGSRVLVIGAPDGFRLQPIPSGVELVARVRPPPDVARVRAPLDVARVRAQLDVVLLFVTRDSELRRRFPALARALAPAGRLWVAWPKKASGIATDLTFETVQRVGLDGGLVDNKSGSIDDEFQGVQFVYRLKDRTGR